MRLYHGTDLDGATAILGDDYHGEFKPMSWFGKDLQTALVFGGQVVFCVFLDPCPEWAKMDEITGWQCRNPEPLPVDGNVMWVRLFSTNTLYLSREVCRASQVKFHRILNPGKVVCLACGGHGEIGWDELTYIKGERAKAKTVPCEKCGGLGAV